MIPPIINLYIELNRSLSIGLNIGVHYTEQRHTGEDEDILKRRKEVYEQARSRNPNRWSGEIRSWNKVERGYLNPENKKNQAEEKEAA
jgi:hypothetical protein